MTAPLSDDRLREIAAGEYGPDAGGYAPNEEEGKAMATELLGLRNAVRYHEEHGRLRTAARAQVPVFDSREGRERGGIADVVASCDPASLVTIKDLALIDEPPGISVGFIIDAASVKALKEQVGAAAVPIEPPCGAQCPGLVTCACDLPVGHAGRHTGVRAGDRDEWDR